jgi:hypothetical protein
MLIPDYFLTLWSKCSSDNDWSDIQMRDKDVMEGREKGKFLLNLFCAKSINYQVNKK